jgi:hypothetical protein
MPNLLIWVTLEVIISLFAYGSISSPSWSSGFMLFIKIVRSLENFSRLSLIFCKFKFKIIFLLVLNKQIEMKSYRESKT